MQLAGAQCNWKYLAVFRSSKPDGRETTRSGFRDRPIQPLSHLSAGVSNIMHYNAQTASVCFTRSSTWSAMRSVGPPDYCVFVGS